MEVYDVEVTRDGGWLMVIVPSLEAVTQARSVVEVPLMARELIAVELGLRLEDVEVVVRFVDEV